MTDRDYMLRAIELAKRGAKIYVTLEPCMQALIDAGIDDITRLEEALNVKGC